MSTAALMLRGTRQPCKASTGPDRTSANNSARCDGHERDVRPVQEQADGARHQQFYRCDFPRRLDRGR